MKVAKPFVALRADARNMIARWLHPCRLGLRPDRIGSGQIGADRVGSDRVGSETQPTLVAAGPCLRKAAALLLLTVAGCAEPGDADWFRAAVRDAEAGLTDTVDVEDRRNIGDSDVAALEGVPLWRLRLDQTGVTDAGMESVAKIPDLEVLSLSGTRVGDRGLGHLKQAQTLRHLTLDAMPITDAGLAHLTELPRLQALSLWKGFITDAGCRHLGQMSGLILLSLDETQVTDAGLRELYKLKNLRRISLWNTQVTDRGVANLQKALPDLEINR